MTTLVYKISALYKKSFYVSIVIYLFEFGLSLASYPRLKSRVPLQLNVSGVVALTTAKYVVLLVPLACLFVDFLSRPEFIDTRYGEESPVGNEVKIAFLLVQLLLTVNSLTYLYLVLTTYLK